MPVLFDIQRCTIEKPPEPVFPLMIYQEKPIFGYLRDFEIHQKEELSKNDPKKILMEEKRKMRERAEAQ